MTSTFDRRRAVTGAAAVAVGVPLLAACAGDDAQDTATDPGSAAPRSEGSASPRSGGAGGGDVLAVTSDVPVNGCLVVASAKVVVTQPSEGEFRAFSATCTHQGCQVSPGSDGVIPCKCHGSEFSLEDGSVVQGPATSALDEVQITVEGDSISLA